MVFETFKDDTESQSYLAKDLGQSPGVVPEDKTESRKRLAETPFEEFDETQLNKQIIDKEEFVETKPENFKLNSIP
jgi:hypothetical protein